MDGVGMEGIGWESEWIGWVNGMYAHVYGCRWHRWFASCHPTLRRTCTSHAMLNAVLAQHDMSDSSLGYLRFVWDTKMFS